MKTPNLTREEIILTLLYHKHYPSIPEKNSTEIMELSSLLRQLSDNQNKTINKIIEMKWGIYEIDELSSSKS